MDPAHSLSIMALQQAEPVLHSALQVGGYIVVVIDCIAHLKHVTFEVVVGGKAAFLRKQTRRLLLS